MMKLLAALAVLALALPVAAQVPPIQPPPGGSGGGMSTDASNGVLPQAATNLGKWTTQIHQNTQTGSCYGTGSGRVLCASDQNHDLIADHSTIQTQDASLISSATVGGTATATDVVGLDWTVASTTYQIRYTVQGGDTTATIATNLAACINAGGATNCTVTAGFLAGLQAFHDANGFGYQPRAAVSTTSSSKFVFDQPWASSGNSVVTFLSGGATETLTLGANNILDNGPYMATSRLVPGRTPVAADQLGAFYFQGQSTSASGIDTQYATLVPRVLVQDSTNPQGELLISTSDSGSAKNNNPKIYVGNGVAFANSAGGNCGYLGLGEVTFCGPFKSSTSTTPQWFGQATGSADFQAITDTGTTGTNNYFVFRYRSANKAQIGQFGANLFGIYDLVNSQYGFQINTSTGAVTLGEAGQLSLPLAGGVVGPGRIISATSDTASAADCGGVLHFTSGSAITATLPNNITTLQCTITYIQEGAGQITFTVASGATLHSFDSYTKTAGQWAVVDITLNTNAGGTSAVYTLSGRGA